ncbi:hypothetical protein C923_00417 [Plasmodium falciparum UGT5.1]|uniref:Duffy-binding-like domain-containing protein n=1 Tax=Plasmodium falciparum UGT5.1 TaxID=1237627 RepID=W7JIY0_PLAFA|nr:hypothetical protein C923_00417 [Plasmodium falciparum UGT5.1]
MVTQNGGGGAHGSGEDDADKYKNAEDAKHLLDIIGKDVYDQVKSEAAGRGGSELNGFLSQARYNGERTNATNACQFSHEYETHVTWGDSYPCAKRSEKRFSDDGRSQCSTSRIIGNNSNTGACAPYRKLQLCDYNLEKITDTYTTTTHNLLVDVCLAAKHEGASLQGYHDKYRANNTDFKTNICTELARSFADIGDIIRGKDLYLGNKKYNETEREKEKLQNNLKSIFKKIYDGLNPEAKQHYSDDEKDRNYYKLREDWWALNRDQVWKAITCSADKGNAYFRVTCSDTHGSSVANHKCRCGDDKKPNDQVPTYFDYVPQYLRWFEEWAEDFCRKRKHKLQNAITNCREQDKDGKDRYCDLNGYDCKGTARGKNKYKYEHDCIECSFSCNPFVEWLDNQQKEFEKQKEKYGNEIKKADGKNGTSITIGDKTINNWYVKEFYEKLREDYGNVEEFLKKLSKEAICKDKPKVGNETADPVDFNNDVNTTFSRTKYCQACPLCGLKLMSPPWDPKGDIDCQHIEIKTFDESNSTPINLLVKNTSGKTMVQKLGSLCGNPPKNNIKMETWKCHYERPGEHYCVLQNDNQGKPQERTIHSFNSLFWRWVTEMLKDSIDWRKEHENCMKKGDKSKCISGCKKPCDCFEKWVQQKQTEWQQVKEHYEKEEGFWVFGPYGALGYLLKEEYFTKIKAPYKEVKSVEEFIKKMEQIIKQYEWNTDATKDNNSINKVLDHEEGIAKECKQKQNDCNKQPKPAESPAPSSPSSPNGPPSNPNDPPANHENEEDEDADDDDDDVSHVGAKDGSKDDEATEDAKVDTAAKKEEKAKDNTDESEPPEKKDKVNPCEIVNTLFTNGDPQNTFKKACEQKYGHPQRHWGWKCVTPTTSNDTTREDGSDRGKRSAPESGSNSDKNGSICIPPRRRKLYIKKIQDWAESQSKTQTSVNGDGNGSQEVVSVNGASESSVSANKQTQQQAEANGASTLSAASTSTSQTSLLRDAQVELRDAFIQSAAIETFFLWHKYKTVKQKELDEKKKQQQENDGLLDLGHDKDPQTELNGGTIPEEFKRQMFYTLGDYRDICVGNTPNGIDKVSASDKDTKGEEKSNNITMKQISDKIKDIVEKPNGVPPPAPGKPSGTPSPPPEKKPVQTPQQWWDDNAKHIWKGMICALAHKTDNPQEVDDKVKKELWDDTKKQPKKDNYTYENVVLKEENSGTRPKPQTESSSASSGEKTTLNNPKLTQFVKRPPYFRYLEEWGETFCRQRTRMLKDVKDNCTKVGKHGNKDCSGDGFDCNDESTKKEHIFKPLNCHSCAKYCTYYKKWIKRKKIEFTKQSNAFTKQKTDAHNNNGFCGKQGKCDTAGAFLERLKNGPCKSNDNEDNNKGDSYIDFNKEDKTFGHENYCDPCSQFKIKCQDGKCTSGDTKVNCNGITTIDADYIKNNKDSTKEVVMRVSDNDTNKFDGGLDACKDAHIFKGIRKEEWTCGNVCGLDICSLKKINNNGQESDEHILIKELIKRWLETFFEDYNRIQKKLKTCKENGKGFTCIKDCVNQWIKKKKEEWQKINEYYIDQYTKENPEGNNLKTFLEELQSLTELNKIMQPCDGLDKFKASLKCNSITSSENSKEKDIVECMLEDLDTKIKTESCPDQPSDKNQTQTCEKYTPPDDEEDLLLEENEKTNKQPSFCPEIKPEPVEDKDGCKPAEAAPKESAPTATSEVQTEQDTKDKAPEAKPPTPALPPPKPKPQPKPKVTPPQNLFEHPAVIPALM